MKPRLLDLYCGAGGCAKGYQMAGFHVVGVDCKPQPRYCGEGFVLGDAIEFCLQRGREFDAIHASPPCQAYSVCTPPAVRGDHPDLLAATREALRKTGRPWVIENVPGAPMEAHLVLTGRMFGLRLQRERWFETSWGAFDLAPIETWGGKVVTVVGHGTPTGSRLANGGVAFTIREKREAMGIDWMNRGESSLAIPPAYTELIGRLILEELAR